VFRDFDPGGQYGDTRFDRSFDLHYQIADENYRLP